MTRFAQWFLVVFAFGVAPCYAMAQATPSPVLPTNAPLPQRIAATYKIFKAGLHIATDEETFERDGERYKITSRSTPTRVLAIFVSDRITIKSEGRITAQGLQPASYEYLRNDPSRAIRATFDWTKKEIRSSHGNTEETFELPDATQDRLSAMYQFMIAIPRTPQVIAWMSSGKKSERYVYVKQGEKTLNTNAGDFATVHFARDAQAGESKAQLWLAKDRFHIPVRIVFEDKNGAFEQVLNTLAIE
jgi:Protein of unknown function (DUF3108)